MYNSICLGGRFQTANGVQFSRMNHTAGKTTFFDMEVDHGHKHILTVCQDRNVRIYSASTGKQIRAFKGSSGDEGTLIKVCCCF